MAKIIKSTQAAAGDFSAYECGALGVACALSEETLTDCLPPLDPVAMAEAEAEQRMQEFYEEGLRRGFEAGQAQFREQVADATQALKAAADALLRARENFLSSIEPQVLALVKAMTERILFREARMDPEVALNTVRAALRNLTERERLTVLLNPDDLKAIQRQQLDLLAGIEGLEQVELTANDTVTPGGCLVESEHVRVDARLDAQLEKILEALAAA